MSLLLCSKNENVLKRWSENLQSDYSLFNATEIEHLDSLYVQYKADLVLLHKSMINRQQLDQICHADRKFTVFLLSDRPSHQEGAAALKMGCSGYANTYMAANQMLAAVQSIQQGKIWTGRALLQYLVQGEEQESQGKKEEMRVDTFNLSDIEYQLASCVAEGLENHHIANHMGITESAVTEHLSNVYQKTDASDRLTLTLLMQNRILSNKETLL